MSVPVIFVEMMPHVLMEIKVSDVYVEQENLVTDVNVSYIGYIKY